ncbi:minor capsid protein [Synechococcus phage Yong-M3-232]|nr:minor capsid protein [Synechococcus phage Yong-M3-232]
MRIPLAQMTTRARPRGRRKAITLQPITLAGTRATDLYRAAYLPIITIWAESQARIVAEYERSLSEITQDSAATLEAEIERSAAQAGAVILAVRARIEGWARMAEAWHRMRWRRTVQAATTIDLATMIGPQEVRETLEAVISRNVGLVRSVSDQTRQRIADSVFRGLQARTPSRQVAREIAEAVGMGRRRALNIASDQNVKLSSALNEERRRQAGIDSWLWVHSSKRHPREEHVVRDGKLYSEDPEKVGTEYEGKLVRRPPDKTDWPGMAPFCGCTSRAVLILE